MTILVTGGAGFIGSNFVRRWLHRHDELVVNLDKLSYAGNLENLATLSGNRRHEFVRGDICNRELVRSLLSTRRPRAIFHFAAETHVDRSIAETAPFVETNVVGTCTLLDEAKRHWDQLPPSDRNSFRFLQVSTDEVYGSLAANDPPFSESTPYAPNSPYAASKAAADHFVRAYWGTYRLPTLSSNCSNNYGPYQFPEKLIPLTLVNALAGRRLPVYGDGLQRRDWLFVHDHCDALELLLERGRPGETYNVGSGVEQTNLQVVGALCRLLDQVRPLPGSARYEDLIEFVTDRPGHDRRYAIDSAKIRRDTGWQSLTSFDIGLRETASWYLSNSRWLTEVQTGDYRDWINRNYGERASA